jgi:hypothetical protein
MGAAKLLAQKEILLILHVLLLSSDKELEKSFKLNRF